jgi:exonuclease V
MSCPERNEDDSDYGSDFTPDEEDLLNELLNKAVAVHATDADATSISTPTWISTPTPVETITAPKSPELADLESLQPAALEAFVADIEDGVELPSVRLPKVLGREGPRSPWRQWQPRPGQAVRWGASASAVGGSDPRAGNNNRHSPSGMLFRLYFSPSPLRLIIHTSSIDLLRPLHPI